MLCWAMDVEFGQPAVELDNDDFRYAIECYNLEWKISINIKSYLLMNLDGNPNGGNGSEIEN